MTREEIAAASLAIRDRLQRAEYLQRACAGDGQLLDEVWALVDAKEKTAQPGFTPGDTAGTTQAMPAAPQGLGSSIGAYRLVRKLGEGGMGVVYLAEQTQPMRRTVALKIVKPGMDSERLIARFESERQALALMDHVHIARVFDAGATPDGRPYFVMELVNGAPITRYCDTKRLTPRERVELFIPVCHAVQHAHQKGIIHRDLKPSNILIAEEDGKPIPKVIDFGIAKAMGDPLHDAAESRFTRLGTVVGTLEYMSPEQADPGRAGIDTRADIYSLGAVLYDLLTGAPPLTGDGQAPGSYLENLKRIQEEEPRSPSARLSRCPTLGEIAERRRTDPARLPKLLHGELDWIVMKALEKDRSRRYETANGLARDLQRYLDGEPVEAAPPSVTYRLRKFAAKYRVWLATAAAFVALLAAGVVVSAWMAVKASQAEQQARAVNDFLQKDLLAQASAANQSQADGKPDPNLKVRTVLDRAAATVATKFAKQPVVEASIRQTIAETYRDLGLYPDAERQLTRALELRRRLLGPSHPDTVQTLFTLAMVAREQGNRAQAESLFSQVLENRRGRLGLEHPDTLKAMHELAELYAAEGKYPQAEELGSRVLEIRRRLLGPEDIETLSSMHELASVYGAEGKDPQAEDLNVRILELQRRVLGPEHPNTLATMNNLAATYLREGKYAQAEKLSAEVLQTQRRTLGPEHPATLTTAVNLAMAYTRQGKLTQAIELDAGTLELDRRVLGPEHPKTLIVMGNLAMDYYNQGEFLKAEALQTQVVEIKRRVLEPNHPSWLTSMQNLGQTYAGLGKFAQADTVFTQILEIKRRVLGAEHPSTLNAMNGLGAAYSGEGKYAQAESLLAQVVETRRRVQGPEHPDTLSSANTLAVVYRNQGKWAQAEALFAQVLDGRRRALGPEHIDTLRTTNNLAMTYQFQGRSAQAEPLLREALPLFEKNAPDHWERFQCQSLLGAAMAGQKKFAAAEPVLLAGYQGMLERKTRIPALEWSSLRWAGESLVELYRAWGKPAKTAEWRQKIAAAPAQPRP